MTYTSFDEYLRVKHMEDDPSLTSDMYVDAFDDWLMEQDPNDIIAWAEKYGTIKEIQGINKAEKIFMNSLKGGEK